MLETALQYWHLGALVILVFEILGILSAIRAIFTTRTTQGAIAWAIALITWPLMAVPLYWIFGRNKFNGYVRSLQASRIDFHGLVDEISVNMQPYIIDLQGRFGDARVLEELTSLPFTRGNQVQLLIDGEQTFRAIFDAIDAAEDYVLAEFYIVNDDHLGRRFKDCLVRAVGRGCRVYFLYDEVGSSKLTRAFLADLAAHGVRATAMNTSAGFGNRFQINFRNHRKIVVVDGREAFVGGHNVGDEYVHLHKRLTPWRDTHVRIVGPAVQAAQLTFVEDWNWAEKQVPEVSWAPVEAVDHDQVVFIVPSGPADEYDTCGLFFTHAINTANERIWISSPYFVPDESVLAALKLASMRGVDVRILIPGMPDKVFIKMAAMSYVPDVHRANVKIYEYSPGFLHQKAFLIDHRVACVGTANLDNRSFRLNFEISVVTIDEEFNANVEAMFERDFKTSRRVTNERLAELSPGYQVGCRIARLFSPIL